MPTTKVVGEENQKATTNLEQPRYLKSRKAPTLPDKLYICHRRIRIPGHSTPIKHLSNMSKPFPLPRQENAKEPDRLEENPDSVKNTHSSAAPTHVTGWRTPSFAAVVEARRRFLNTRAARHVAAHGDRRGHLLGGTLWPRLSVPRETAVVRALAREKGEGGSP